MLNSRKLLWIFAASPLVLESGCKGFGSCEWRKSTYVTDAHAATGDLDWAEVSFKTDRNAVSEGLNLQATKGQLIGLAVYDFHFVSEEGDYDLANGGSDLKVERDENKSSSRFVSGFELNNWGESLLRKITERSAGGPIVVYLRKARLGTETAIKDKTKVSRLLDLKREDSIRKYVSALAPDSAVSVLAVDIEPMTMLLDEARSIFKKHGLRAAGGLDGRSFDGASNSQQSNSADSNPSTTETSSQKPDSRASGNAQNNSQQSGQSVMER